MPKVIEESGPLVWTLLLGRGDQGRVSTASTRLEFLPGGPLWVWQRLQDGRRREKGELGRQGWGFVPGPGEGGAGLDTGGAGKPGR